VLASLKWERANASAVSAGPGGPDLAVQGGAVRGGALDVLRFVAALLIVLYHFGTEAPKQLELIHPVFARGYLATDFFLMLSGFVLGRAYGRQVAAARIGDGRFWIRRVGRIWPGHAIMLAAFVAAVLVFNMLGSEAHNPTRFTWSALPMQFFLVHAWGAPGGDGWNLPSWSLSALIVCYAAFPAVWRVLARLRSAIAAPLIGVAAIAAVDWLCWKFFGRALFDLPFEMGLVRAAPLFLMGACLARSVDSPLLGQILSRGLLWGGIAVFVGAQLFGRFDALSIAALAAIMVGAGRLPVKKPWPAAETAAKLSYALFITHTFVGFLYYLALHSLIQLTPIPLETQWPLWLAGFPLAVAGAWAFDKWIDAPLQQRLAPWLNPRRPVAAVAVTAPAAAPPIAQQASDQAAT
jgi:peptidoglycan/LPS O-acetylase OafA/YrhL